VAVNYDSKGEFTTTSTAQGTFAVPKPSGTASGHVLLAFVIATDTVGGPPAGFTSMGTFAAATNVTLSTFYKVAGGSEPATYDFSFAPNSRFGCAAVLDFTGVDTSAPTATPLGTTDSGISATAIPCPAQNAQADQMLVCAYGITGGNTTGPPYNWFTPPASMTERVDLSATSTTRRSLGVATQLLAAAESTGTKTATASTAGLHDGFSVLLSPSGGVVAADLIGMVGG
jgi:hypothetical protein